MILTGGEIQRERARGTITIDPFDDAQLNPNSYNYRMVPELKCCTDAILDASYESTWCSFEVPEDGLVLEPHILYLGATVERIGSASYVTSLMGRSSIGRLGMFLQASADIGNLGAIHSWTLEIKVVQRLRVYPYMLAGQVSFWKPKGQVRLYSGRYHLFSEPTPLQRWHIGGAENGT